VLNLSTHHFVDPLRKSPKNLRAIDSFRRLRHMQASFETGALQVQTSCDK